MGVRINWVSITMVLNLLKSFMSSIIITINQDLIYLDRKQNLYNTTF